MLILLLNSCFCSIWSCISNLFLSHAVLFLLHNSLRESLFPQACPYPWIRYLLIQSLCWIHLHKTSSSPSSIVIILAHTWSLQSSLPQSTIIINLLYQCHSLIVIIFQVEVQVRHCSGYMDQASELIILLYYFGGQYNYTVLQITYSVWSAKHAQAYCFSNYWYMSIIWQCSTHHSGSHV